MDPNNDKVLELQYENDRLRRALNEMLRLVGELTGDRTSGMAPVKMAHEALYG